MAAPQGGAVRIETEALEIIANVFGREQNGDLETQLTPQEDL